jgi:hypothetical protein
MLFFWPTQLGVAKFLADWKFHLKFLFDGRMSENLAALSTSLVL